MRRPKVLSFSLELTIASLGGRGVACDPCRRSASLRCLGGTGGAEPPRNHTGGSHANWLAAPDPPILSPGGPNVGSRNPASLADGAVPARLGSYVLVRELLPFLTPGTKPAKGVAARIKKLRARLKKAESD